MGTLFHYEKEQESIFFPKLEGFPPSSCCAALTDCTALNKKHVVHTVLSALLVELPPDGNLRGNDVRTLYSCASAHNQFRPLVIIKLVSWHSARSPPRSFVGAIIPRLHAMSA